MQGIDVSHHQPELPDLTGIDFVVCRATYGVTPDRKYPDHAAAVRAAGRVLGAYHFARLATMEPVEAQVAAFLGMARGADFLVIDREKDGDNGTISITATRRFIDLVHEQGLRIGLYSSESQYREAGQDFAWIANWSSEPSIPWDLWQHTNRLGGNSLDGDRFRGTKGALLALGGPLREWVIAEQARSSIALDAANREAAKWEAMAIETAEALVDAERDLQAANAEISGVAAGLSAVAAFHERHP